MVITICGPAKKEFSQRDAEPEHGDRCAMCGQCLHCVGNQCKTVSGYHVWMIDALDPRLDTLQPAVESAFSD